MSFECPSLPLEVVSIILQHACHVEPASAREPKTKGILSSRAMQWVLLRVCKDWHTTVTNCPALWTEVHIHLNSELGLEHISVIELVLGRSRDRLLDVEIVDTRRDAYGTPPDVASAEYELLVKLFSHSRRWRSLELNFSRRLPESIIGLLDDCFPRLEKLVLIVCQPWQLNDEYELTFVPIRGFSRCPLLHTVDIPKPCASDIPWACIKHYGATPPIEFRSRPPPLKTWSWIAENFQAYLRDIASCEVLESLSFGVSDVQVTTPIPSSSLVILPTLQSLDSACTHLLDYLVLSNLKELYFHLRGDRETWAIRAVDDLLTRSDCEGTLTVLRLANLLLPKQIFLPMLDRLLNLEVLGVDGGYYSFHGAPKSESVTQDLLVYLDDRQMVRLPRLRTLEFSMTESHRALRIPSEMLVQCLRYRWAGTPGMARLRRATMILKADMFFNVPIGRLRQGMNALVDEGMSLTVTVADSNKVHFMLPE